MSDENAGAGHDSARPRRRLGLGLLLGGIAAIVAAAANLEAFFGLIGRVAPPVAEASMATAMRWSVIRTRVANDVAQERFQQKVCHLKPMLVDLDGNGMAADLAIYFSPPKPDLKSCYADEGEGEQEIAFFRWTGTGYAAVGNPPKPSETAAWEFVGPILLRMVANSDTPPVEVFMLNGNGLLERIDTIDTFNQGERSWKRTRPIPHGAQILVPTGLWEAIRTPDGKGKVTRLSMQAIMANDGHSRLLKWELGELTLDGQPVPVTETPVEDDSSRRTASIALNPLDRLYLEGCEPETNPDGSPAPGLTEHPKIFGAYIVDLPAAPTAACPLNEDDDTLRVKLTS